MALKELKSIPVIVQTVIILRRQQQATRYRWFLGEWKGEHTHLVVNQAVLG